MGIRILETLKGKVSPAETSQCNHHNSKVLICVLPHLTSTPSIHFFFLLGMEYYKHRIQ